jgi:hypothetical protein
VPGFTNTDGTAVFSLYQGGVDYPVLGLEHGLILINAENIIRENPPDPRHLHSLSFCVINARFKEKIGTFAKWIKLFSDSG